MSSDVKGDAYEGLLEKNAEDTKAERATVSSRRARDSCFRRLHRASSGEVICDLRAAPRGFLLSPRIITSRRITLSTSIRNVHLRYDALRGSPATGLWRASRALRDEHAPARYRSRRRRT